MKPVFERVKVQLECGHVSLFHVEHGAHVPPDYVRCDDCKGDVALFAVECREHYARCPSCTFARWTGESIDMAYEVKRRHWTSTNHVMSVRYTIHPAKFEELKKRYKRTVRFRIDAAPKIVYPRIRNVDDDGVFPF